MKIPPKNPQNIYNYIPTVNQSRISPIIHKGFRPRICLEFLLGIPQEILQKIKPETPPGILQELPQKIPAEIHCELLQK